MHTICALLRVSDDPEIVRNVSTLRALRVQLSNRTRKKFIFNRNDFKIA